MNDKEKVKNPKRPPMALALAGGGIIGWLYETGSLAALDDFLGDEFQVTDFDIVIGTSAGGILGTLIANGVSPETVYKSVIRHRQTYLSLQSSDFYSVDMSNVWKTFSAIIIQTSKGFWRWMRHPLSTRFFDVVWNFQESLPPGIFTVERLHRFLRYVMVKNRLIKDFRKLDKLFFVTATELDTGERFVFGKGYVEDVPIYTAITASACIPLFFKPVNVNGHDLVDGGVGPVASLDLALDHGAKLIFAINPVVPIYNDRDTVKLERSFFQDTAPYLREKGPAIVGDQILKIDNQVKFRMGIELAKAKNPDLEIISITPDPKETLMFTTPAMDLDRRIEIVNYGYESTVRNLTKNFDHLKTVFGKFGISVSLDNFEANKITREKEAQIKK